MDSDVAIPPGTVVLDKYRVVRTLGVGGMGLVVSAIHVALGTPVAIKFLLPQFAASSEAARRFVREAQAASKIASEHVVRVFDAGTSQPYGPYIVMEFLEGHDLARLNKQRGPFSIGEAVDFTVQAAKALAEAHAQGVVHRDVKPANLFLVEQPDGSALIKVLDFGISKVAEGNSLEVTKTSAVLGSGLYMSPEQMKASKMVDHRTDVYALGVTLFELLTRTQPHTAESFAELAIKVNMEAPTDIRKLRPEVPVELGAAIARAYAKKADDRYQSMAELALALEPWAESSTRNDIDALTRTEKRRGRASSWTPSSPPGLSGSDLVIPRPAALPSPESVGMDTFGLSKKRGGRDSLHQTSEKSFVSAHRSRGSAGMLGVGIGVGVAAAAALAYFTLRTPASPEVARGPIASAEQSATATATSHALADPSPRSSGPSPPEERSLRTSAPARSSAVKSAPPPPPTEAAAVMKTSEPAPMPTATEAVPPAPVDPPCKIRDLDGTLRDCPTK